MRSYTQVKDILDRISQWHGELLDDCCEGTSADADDPLRPLVDYLATHMQGVRQVLDRYEPTERDAIRNTWLQYIPAEEVEKVLAKRQPTESMTAEQAVAMMIEFDDALVALYTSLANQAQAPPRVNEIFRSLLEMEEWQKLRTAWAARDSDSFATGRS